MFFCKPPSWVGQPCGITATLTSMVFNQFYSPAGKEIALTSLISDFLPLGGGKRGSFYVDVLNVSRIELHQHRVERSRRLCCGWEQRWMTSWSAERPIRPGTFPGRNLVAYVKQRRFPSRSQTEKGPTALNWKSNLNRGNVQTLSICDVFI